MARHAIALNEPEILPLGQDGVIVRFARRPSPNALAAAQAFYGLMNITDNAGISEVAPSLASVLLRFDPTKTTRATVEALARHGLSRLATGGFEASPSRRIWHLPVAFGGDMGPQLAEAAALAGISEEEAVREISGAELRVLAIGFAPGQPYIGLLPDNWNMPRLSQLTPKVPAGALVVALRQLVLFCNDSTTGWRMVGQTGFRPFWPQSQTPFRLQVGDAIRIEPIGHVEFAALGASDTEGLGGARLEVLG